MANFFRNEAISGIDAVHEIDQNGYQDQVFQYAENHTDDPIDHAKGHQGSHLYDESFSEAVDAPPYQGQANYEVNVVQGLKNNSFFYADEFKPKVNS